MNTPEITEEELSKALKQRVDGLLQSDKNWRNLWGLRQIKNRTLIRWTIEGAFGYDWCNMGGGWVPISLDAGERSVHGVLDLLGVLSQEESTQQETSGSRHQRIVYRTKKGVDFVRDAIDHDQFGQASVVWRVNRVIR